MTDLPKITPYLEKMIVGFEFGGVAGQQLMNVLMQLTKQINLPYYYAAQWFEDLFLTYHQTRRAYHNVAHLHNFLQLVDVYEKYLMRPDLFRWAILYHDYIYEIDNRDNEALSAAKAKSVLKPYLKSYEIAYIQTLILATQEHTLPTRADLLHLEPVIIDILLHDLPFFLDFDMAILASPKEIYHQYTQNLLLEYTTIYPLEIYRKGRQLVLEDFLTRKHLYYSPLQAELQSLAWWNMRREIDMIQWNVS